MSCHSSGGFVCIILAYFSSRVSVESAITYESHKSSCSSALNKVKTGCLEVFQSLHITLLQVSVLIPFSHKKVLCFGLSNTLIYGYSNVPLMVISLLEPNNSSRFTARAYDLLVPCSWQVLQCWYRFNFRQSS